MQKLDGKVAIITGASSGIGAATAIALAEAGARVAISARRLDRLETLARRITAAGGQAMSIAADVADEAQVREMLSQTQSALGRVDILINNAGVALLGPIDGADTEDWRRMMNLNVMGLMYATHAVLPVMKTQGEGHIVNVSSLAGRIANAGTAVYNASKWAVGAFSEALRKEVYRDNIRVSIVEPGVVATEIYDNITNPQVREQTKAYVQSQTGKPLQPEDIAAAIVYAVTQPSHVNVNEILIRPTSQER